MSLADIAKNEAIQVETEKPSAYRWVILVVCFLAFLAKYADEMVWVPLIPIAKETLGFTATQAGVYMSARAMGVLVAQIPGGILADRYGPKPVLIISMVLAAFCSIGVGVSNSFNQGVAFRFLTGLVVGPCYAAGAKLVISWFPKKERATAMGLYLMATTAATALVNALVPTIAKTFSWQYGFYFVGIFSLSVSVLCLLLVKEGKFITEKKSGFKISHLKEIYLDKNILLAVVVGFGALWATWGVGEWTGSYFKKGLGLSNVQSGMLMAFWSVSAMVCKPVVGFISDKMGAQRKPIILIDLILFTILLLIVPFVSNVSLFYFLTPFLGFVAFAYSAPFNTLIPELARPHLAASAISIYMMATSLGGMIRPVIIGKILDTGSPNAFMNAFFMLAVGPVVALIALVFLRETKKHDLDEAQ